MKLQNILDLSTFEITRFRIWNQTSQPSDKGLGSKYFNTNSGHEAYGREQIYTPKGWRTAAYMDDIEAINEKLDLIFGDEIDTDTIIDSWKEVQDFLAGIEDTTTLITLLDDKLSKSEGGTMTGRLKIQNEGTAWILFESASASFGSLGMNESGPRYWDGSQGFNLIHSGNIKDYKAGGLAKSVSIWGQSFDGTRNIASSVYLPNAAAMYYADAKGANRIAITLNSDNVFSIGFGIAIAGYNTEILGNNIFLKYGTSRNTGLILSSSGNVGIGPTIPQYKLDVAGDVGISGLANLNGGALIPTGKNMMFGDASGNAIMEYDEDANAIKVTGNFYATGTVASGGKAQEGTGTGGSATVYPFTLTYGQSAYQIANPKSNTNVIVQVYEWNATTSSWDLILTDVNVTASKITVTFGRTTTVNHMVTVV